MALLTTTAFVSVALLDGFNNFNFSDTHARYSVQGWTIHNPSKSHPAVSNVTSRADFST